MSLSKRFLSISVRLVFLLLVSSTLARADTFSFDFESTSEGVGLSSLALTQGSLTMTLTRPGSTFQIVNASSLSALGFPASWGARTLGPGSDNSNKAFLANFSQDVSQVTLDVGDFGLPDVDLASLLGFQGFDASGALIDLDIRFIPFAPNNIDFRFITLTVNGGLMRSLGFIGGSADFPNSVLYDNITVQTVPEPVSMMLLGSGLAGLAFKLRRRSRN